MKRFLIIVIAIVVIVLGADALYYRAGWYIDFAPNQAVTAEFIVEDGQICKRSSDGEYTPFGIKAVNLTSAKPGSWTNDFAVDENTYLRWLSQIQEMGANTVRLYTILSDTFYNAFYRYNQGRTQPLYLIQGTMVDDYVLNSRYDAYHNEFYETFYQQVKTSIEVIHGDRKIDRNAMKNVGYGSYLKDVSPWVLGYIWGVDWDGVTIAYANDKYSDLAGYNSYQGEYLYTDENATPFETMLTQVGDRALAYESKRYKQQRVFAFANSAVTDPIVYPSAVESMFQKCAFLDVERICATERVVAGQFAAYNVQPYYPDYLRYLEDEDWTEMGLDKSLFASGNGVNTYKAYLQLLNEHHDMPIVISGLGFSSSRGISRTEDNTARVLGGMSEQAQGEAIVSCYEDILASGCVGTCLSEWQDEWQKTSWNTTHSSDSERTAFWNDAQTSEQSCGFLAFDTGKTESICYVDGSISEWSASDVVKTNSDGSSVSLKYDEKYLYFMVKKQGFHIDRDTLYIPIDTTQKSGSNYCNNYGLKFDRAADFVIAVNGKTGTRVLVQEYYELLRAKYSLQVYGFNTYLNQYIPDRESSSFKSINMILQLTGISSGGVDGGVAQLAPVQETGLLRYGNGNPASAQYDSLSDFMAGDGFVEIRIPWSMLNFYDPSTMKIHDDYYQHHGVVGMSIDKMYVGVTSLNSSARIQLGEKSLKGWDMKVSYHERLKESYYVVQKAWTE